MRNKLLLSAFIISLIVNTYFIILERVHIFDYLAKKFHPKKTIVFFGDSRIQNGDWSWHYKRLDVQKSGFPGYTTQDLIPELKTGILDFHPKKCFIQAGINDVLMGLKYQIPIHNVCNNYRFMIDQLISNGVTPVIQSVIYVNTQKSAIVNSKVDTINNFLKNYCRQKNVQFIDINEPLEDNNRLDMKYSIGDGVHFNQQGYAIWYNKIKPYIF